MDSDKNSIEELAEHLIELELRVQRQARKREKDSVADRRDLDSKGGTDPCKNKE